jgi:hypothetical protein
MINKTRHTIVNKFGVPISFQLLFRHQLSDDQVSIFLVKLALLVGQNAWLVHSVDVMIAVACRKTSAHRTAFLIYC